MIRFNTENPRVGGSIPPLATNSISLGTAISFAPRAVVMAKAIEEACRASSAALMTHRGYLLVLKPRNRRSHRSHLLLEVRQLVCSGLRSAVLLLVLIQKQRRQ